MPTCVPIGSFRDAVRSGEPSAVGYLAGWRLANLLPGRLTRGAADMVARGMVGRHSYRQLRLNLGRVVGPGRVTDELVADSLASYARYWVEAFRLPTMAMDLSLVHRLERSIVGLKHLEVPLASGRGVVLTLPHSGNWDMAGVWLAHRCGGFTTVAEHLKPEAVYRAFVDYRKSLGFSVIGHAGGGAVYPRLASVVRTGGVVCLMGERDLTHTGVPVRFLGDDALFPVGPAKLAVDEDACLHVVHCWFTPNGWGMSVSEDLSHADGLPSHEDERIGALTQKVADGFGANIRRHPADWHMLQPLFLGDLDADRLARSRAKGE